MKCAKCQIGDHPVLEGFDNNMQPIMAHFIRFDAYPLDRNHITETEKSQGFLFKIHEGKPIKYRHLCTPCYAAQADTDDHRKNMREDLARRGRGKGLRDSFFVQQFQLNTD